ncbi:39060_t:CDS:2 [Gigaspora margarita]|uniref:39060_t:CDS:1 n=1 Tax=Gigaspora margarita TaxID=4874 RepID=A0ABM8W415_GIGMA|nr:39060_t:CDS:2 [Gigaspora margarita]
MSHNISNCFFNSYASEDDSDANSVSFEVSNFAFEATALNSFYHFWVLPSSGKIFISYCLDRFINYWYGNSLDFVKIILCNLARDILCANNFNLNPEGDFIWIVYSNDLLTDPSDNYMERISSPSLNLSPIEVEILNFFKGYSSYNSMVTEHDEGFIFTLIIVYLAKADTDLSILRLGLSSILYEESSLAHKFNKKVKSVEIHIEFLTKLFKSFGLREDIMKQLDRVLTSVANKLKSLKFKHSDKDEEFSYLICYSHFEKVSDLDIKVLKICVFLIKIKNSFMDMVLGKGRYEELDFEMNYQDYQFTMNVERMDKLQDAIKDFIKEFSGNAHKDVIGMLSPVPIKS